MADITQYAGSPDLFEGNRWIPEEEAKSKGYFNPGVFKSVNTARPDLKADSDYARLSQKDIGWTDPTLAPDYTDNPGPESGLIGDTSDIRTNVSNLNGELSTMANGSTNMQYQNILNGILGVDPSGNPVAGTPSYMNDLNALNQMRQGLNSNLSPEEQARVEAAGKAAGGQYDPEQARLMEEKRQGMPKAIIAAGERGGFMNTQFAGRAAVQPVEGETFVGAGGQLERVKSAYDLNLSDLQMKKNNAITTAKSKMEEFIRSGRRQDYEDAQGMFKLARDTEAQQENIKQDKLNTVLKIQQIETEMNKPLGEANEAVQDYAMKMMAKYPSGFTDVGADALTQMTPAQINQRILRSQEYKTESALSAANLGDKTAPSESPIHKEWADYVREGGTLSFNDYMNADAGRGRSVTHISVGQQTANNYAGAFANSLPKLESSKGGGEFFDGNVYQTERKKFATQYGKADPFDEAFGSQLSPSDRAKYGIGKAAGVKAADSGGGSGFDDF